jgi:AcrR family transcriptional regulator
MGSVAARDVGAPAPEARVVAAALACFARWGIAKTTLDDVAREAGSSRATVYRLFPGGKETLVDAVISSELHDVLTDLGSRLEAAVTLEDKLTDGILFASGLIAGHSALRYMLDHEPEQVLPHLAFDRFDAILAEVAVFVAPYLAPHVGEELALRTGEWVTRVICSYNLYPSESFDFTVEADVRRFVSTFFLPALSPARAQPI